MISRELYQRNLVYELAQVEEISGRQVLRWNILWG